mmetsp:Transcript_10705/g.11659  ORF Transcript_10705/g.11659 Transcript_10705/m.11659 type:complete len:498 (-) Transcript_10705:179-1672(-)
MLPFLQLCTSTSCVISTLRKRKEKLQENQKRVQIFMEEAKTALMSDSILPSLQASVLIKEKPFLIESNNVFLKVTCRESSAEEYFNYADIVGASISVQDGVTLTIHSYPRMQKGCKKTYTRVLYEVSLSFEDQPTAQQWRDEVYRKLNDYAGRGPRAVSYQDRKILVFVNPVSGKKRAVKVWRSVSQVLKHTNCQIDVHETQRKDDARDRVHDMAIGDYDVVVTVSGDGLIHEVINGVMTRSDHEDFWEHTQLGVLPGGSANAMAKCICATAGEEFSALHSAFLIAKGGSSPLDLTKLDTQKNGMVYSFMSFTWAYIAECDLWSEHLRWIGNARFELYGFYRALALNKYQAKFSWTTQNDSDLTLSDSLTDDWETIDDTFINILNMNIPYVASWSEVAPRARMDDRTNECIISHGKNCGRGKLAKFLLTQMDDGSWIKDGEVAKNSGVWATKATSWRFIPDEPERSIMSIDGEPYDSQVVHATIMPSAIPICGFQKV